MPSGLTLCCCPGALAKGKPCLSCCPASMGHLASTLQCTSQQEPAALGVAEVTAIGTGVLLRHGWLRCISCDAQRSAGARPIGMAQLTADSDVADICFVVYAVVCTWFALCRL